LVKNGKYPPNPALVALHSCRPSNAVLSRLQVPVGYIAGNNDNALASLQSFLAAAGASLLPNNRGNACGHIFRTSRVAELPRVPLDQPLAQETTLTV